MPNRSALILLACVAGLVLFVGGLAVGVFVGRRGLDARPSSAARTASANEADLYARIAGHKFWKVKVTPAMVGELAEKVRREKRTSVIYIDDGFNTGIFHDEIKDGVRLIEIGPSFMGKPANVGKRYLYIDLYRTFSSEPSAADVASKLLSEVEARDYKD